MKNKRNDPLHYGWIILIIAVVTVMGSLGFARFGYTMILPSMKGRLGLTDSQAGDLAMGNMIGYLALAIACGFLSARFSSRLIISGFMVLVSASMFLTGISENFGTALVSRILSGMGSGGTNIPIMGVVVSWFALSRRGFATGITVSGSSFGLLITGLVIPQILNSFGSSGWRYSWFFLSAISMMIALLCAFFLRNSPSEKSCLPIGAKEEETIQMRGATQSLLQSFRLVYRSFQVWHLAFIYILFGFSYIIYTTFFVRYLSWEGGFTIESAGWLWSLVGAVSITSGFIWGTVSDRMGRKYGLAFVFIIQFACYMLFGLWKDTPGYYLSSLLFALTAWSIPAIMAAASGDLLGPKLAPVALGFITLFFGIGQALGPFLAGRIADAFGSYSLAFIIAGFASLAGGVLSMMLKMKKMN